MPVSNISDMQPSASLSIENAASAPQESQSESDWYEVALQVNKTRLGNSSSEEALPPHLLSLKAPVARKAIFPGFQLHLP